MPGEITTLQSGLMDCSEVQRNGAAGNIEGIGQFRGRTAHYFGRIKCFFIANDVLTEGNQHAIFFCLQLVINIMWSLGGLLGTDWRRKLLSSYVA